MIQIQYLASQLWSGSLMMIIITFDLKALCRSLYAFFLECVVCFCYLYYIIMMIISVWQRDTSCFHWYILLHIKLWNLLLFCYGWICRVVLHDNLLCCTVIFFSSSQFRPTCRSALSLSGFKQKAFSYRQFSCNKKISSLMISEYVESSITTFLALDCEFKWTGWSYQIHISLMGFLQDMFSFFPVCFFFYPPRPFWKMRKNGDLSLFDMLTGVKGSFVSLLHPQK